MGYQQEIKEERMALHLQGLSAAEIARRTGYHQVSILTWLKRHGLKPNGGHGGKRPGCGRKPRGYVSEQCNNY